MDHAIGTSVILPKLISVLQYALHPPAVIIVHQKTYPLSRGIHYTVPSTRFPTGTVLALPAAFRFKDYHPYLSQYFSSCGSHYPETPGTFFINTVWNSKTALMLLKSCCVKTTVNIKIATLNYYMIVAF